MNPTCLPGQAWCSDCTQLLGLVDKLSSQFRNKTSSARLAICAQIFTCAYALTTVFKLRIKKQMSVSCKHAPDSAHQH